MPHVLYAGEVYAGEGISKRHGNGTGASQPGEDFYDSGSP